MLESKWEIDKEQGKGWEYNDFGNSLFAALAINPLEDELVKFLQNSARTNGELYEFTLHSGFLPKHTNEVFRNMQSNNKIKIKPKDGSKPRVGAFYISYEHYKSTPDKVIVTLN